MAGITKGAFGKDKVIQDITDIHSLFTFDIPDATMKVVEKINGVIHFYETNDQAQYVKSIDGELVCQAGPNKGDVSAAYSKRHPRLKPNRGLIASPSIFCDSFQKAGAEVEYGLFNLNETTFEIDDGITAAYIKGEIYLRVYSKGEMTLNEPVEHAVLSRIDELFNPAKGHLFDIQGQWRGVGDFYYWISSPYDDLSYKIGEYTALNRKANLTTANPAMHFGYIARNNGDAGEESAGIIRSGCFDVSSEGGIDEKQFPFQVKNKTTINCQIDGTICLVFKNPFKLKNKLNTRDIQLYEISASCDKKGSFELYFISDESRLTKTGGFPLTEEDWSQMAGGSCIQYIDNSVGINGLGLEFVDGFDETGIDNYLSKELQGDVPKEYVFPSPERIPVWKVHGEIMVLKGYSALGAMKLSSLYGELI